MPKRSHVLPAVALAGVGFLAGCAVSAPAARPLSPETTAAALAARTLHDDGLRRFLTENTGREFPSWPLTAWDFETLSWVAFYYNPTLDVARAQWELARAGLVTAAARPNPTLVLTPGDNTNAPAGVSPWFPAINADFLFETAGKRERRIAAAKLSAESSLQAFFGVAWQVRGDLRRALNELGAAERKQAQADNQVALRRRILDLLHRRLAAGAVSSAEIVAPRVALARAEADAADAARQLPLARQHVAQVLGVPLSALADVELKPVPTSAPLSPEVVAAARRISLQSRSDVLGALANYDASQAALAGEAARRFPDVHLGPGYQWDQGADKWSLALSLELPLFNHNEGPIAEAAAKRHEAAARFLATQARVISEIDAAVAAQQAAALHLEQVGRIQNELEKQEAEVRARLAAGSADRLEIETARLELAAGELACIDAGAQAAFAAGQLEDALQVPFPRLAALVNAPPSPLP